MGDINNQPYPQNIDAERAVLGAMLLPDESAVIIDNVLAMGLKASDFYKESHQKIYRAILAIYEAGDPVDLVSLTTKMQATGDLENIGGLAYLNELEEGLPTAAHTEYYLRQIQDAAQLRSIIQISHRTNRKAYEPEAVPGELLSELQDLVSQGRLSESIAGRIPTAKEDWAGVFEQLCRFRESEYIGLRTGFHHFDSATLGLRGLSVLGGIPGQGKSSFALQVATQIAETNGIPVLFYALEMSKFDVYTKIVSRLSKLDWKTLMIGSEIDGRRGQGLSEEDTHKLNKATAELMVYADLVKIVDRSVCRDISLSTLRLHIQQARKEHQTDQVFVVVDHLQIFPCDRSELTDMKSRIDYLVAEFKAIAEQHAATILLVSEKNRSSYTKEWLGAFMGSAGIEYGVDVAMLLHDKAEDGASYPIPEGDRELELKIVKGRFTGRKDIKFKFYPTFSNFEEL